MIPFDVNGFYMQNANNITFKNVNVTFGLADHANS